MKFGFFVWDWRTVAERGGSAICCLIPGAEAASETRAGCPFRFGQHGFRRVAGRKASFRGFRWKEWISAAKGSPRFTFELAATILMRIRVAEPWRSMVTRSHGTSVRS